MAGRPLLQADTDVAALAAGRAPYLCVCVCSGATDRLGNSFLWRSTHLLIHTHIHTYVWLLSCRWDNHAEGMWSYFEEVAGRGFMTSGERMRHCWDRHILSPGWLCECHAAEAPVLSRVVLFGSAAFGWATLFCSKWCPVLADFLQVGDLGHQPCLLFSFSGVNKTWTNHRKPFFGSHFNSFPVSYYVACVEKQWLAGDEPGTSHRNKESNQRLMAKRLPPNACIITLHHHHTQILYSLLISSM